MNNLVYLSYGDGPHIDELVYSVLSATQMIGSESGEYRVIVYTDHPAHFVDLPVRIEGVSEDVLVDWAGPWDDRHHYWLPERRALFHSQLDRVLRDASIASDEERLRRLLPYRPSQRFKDRPFRGPLEKGIKARLHSGLWSMAFHTGLLNPMKRIATRLRVYHRTSV